jgi:hypothetical protein
VARRRLAAVVEHRVDRHQKGERGAAAVPGEEGHAGGETTTGAPAVDGDAVRVDTGAPGLSGEPGQSGVAVLDRGGVGMLRRQAVVDRDGHTADGGGEGGGDDVLGLDAADDHPAPVDVQHTRCGGNDPGRAVDTYGDVRRPGGSGHGAVLACDALDGRCTGGEGGGELLEPDATGGDVLDGAQPLRSEEPEEQRQRLAEIGMDAILDTHNGEPPRYWAVLGRTLT